MCVHERGAFNPLSELLVWLSILRYLFLLFFGVVGHTKNVLLALFFSFIFGLLQGCVLLCGTDIVHWSATLLASITSSLIFSSVTHHTTGFLILIGMHFVGLLCFHKFTEVSEAK